MDFKKFASDAGTFLNRAKQFTEEKLGQAERTELDAHFENLLQRADKTKLWTEKILGQTEAVLQPNPTIRVESYFFEKMEKKKLEKQTNTEYLGSDMIEAGNEFGPGTSYGTALIKCGQTEQRLGLAEKEFVTAAANNFLQPLRAFLDGDMKTVAKERKVLEMKRLDLDACKTRLRRAKSIGSKDQAEAELRVAQSEFDRQAEITKLLLEGISSTHAHHLRCLHDFVEAQTSYYAQCQQHMADLQKQLGSFSATNLNHNMAGGVTLSPGINPPSSTPTTLPYSGVGSSTHTMGSGFGSLTNTSPTAPPSSEVNNSSLSKRAKVLYDYDAADQTEISLIADEVITIYNIPGKDDWVMGERGTQKGKVPLTYLQVLG